MPSIGVLAIDPGEKVGWAHGEIDSATGALRIESHGIVPLKQFALILAGQHEKCDSNMHIGAYDVVIYETWRLAADKAKELIGSDMQSSQLIGMVRLLAWLHDVKLVSQAPKDMAVGARVAPGTVRDILGTLPKAHDESHDGSALKHLAYYWYRHHFDPTQEAL